METIVPVGDPTVWGGSLQTVIDAEPVLGSTPRVVASGQIILAQAADRYARNWSIVGNLSLPIAGWEGPVTYGGPPYAADFETEDPMGVWLEVTQGVGQMTIKQLILLKAGPGVGGVSWGLVNQQFTLADGPYGETYNNTFNYDPVLTTERTRSFATIGAWIGNTISARVLYVRGGTVGQPANIPYGRVSLLLTPYAPGAGL